MARLWVPEDGESVDEVSRRLRRARSSVWELLADDLGERPGVAHPRTNCSLLHCAGTAPLDGFPRRLGGRGKEWHAFIEFVKEELSERIDSLSDQVIMNSSLVHS